VKTAIARHSLTEIIDEDQRKEQQQEYGFSGNSDRVDRKNISHSIVAAGEWQFICPNCRSSFSSFEKRQEHMGEIHQTGLI
jgi:hypothetical protein